MKPDKGTGIVILNTTDYVNKMEQIILDETKFRLHKNQDLYSKSRSIERKVRIFSENLYLNLDISAKKRIDYCIPRCDV